MAPLTLVTQAGPHYFIRVFNPETRATVLTAFVRAGERADLGVPFGIYRIHYAIGKKWYGENYLFGPETEVGDGGFKFRFPFCSERRWNRTDWPHRHAVCKNRWKLENA